MSHFILRINPKFYWVTRRLREAVFYKKGGGIESSPSVISSPGNSPSSCLLNAECRVCIYPANSGHVNTKGGASLFLGRTICQPPMTFASLRVWEMKFERDDYYGVSFIFLLQYHLGIHTCIAAYRLYKY